ncbi:hypothetical protein L596_018775 [Steinernema carpocapsae]|uniref:Uncharacterized protein n=1 Tax=Steinernema carpocapsae TaxID=34508 RepID=A0A4U5N5N2_STECR|nr:hypothetical protein L596_018775 [Steinernema carpocapsae]
MASDPLYSMTFGQRMSPSFLDVKELNMMCCSDVWETKLPCIMPRPDKLRGAACVCVLRQWRGCGADAEAYMATHLRQQLRRPSVLLFLLLLSQNHIIYCSESIKNTSSTDNEKSH